MTELAESKTCEFNDMLGSLPQVKTLLHGYILMAPDNEQTHAYKAQVCHSNTNTISIRTYLQLQRWLDQIGAILETVERLLDNADAYQWALYNSVVTDSVQLLHNVFVNLQDRISINNTNVNQVLQQVLYQFYHCFSLCTACTLDH